ncbi:hypothetical protein ILYODFUR_020120 [Ilyodon furcidens]|uniref:Uncharacterized protein n=1 Tax=Ilyodon furcidens TaxID=33524 RepID=A0ABV0VFI3_9TELE
MSCKGICALNKSGLYGRVRRRKCLPQVMKVTQRAWERRCLLQPSFNMQNAVLQKANTTHHPEHISIMLWFFVFLALIEKQVRVDGKIDEAKNRKSWKKTCWRLQKTGD